METQKKWPVQFTRARPFVDDRFFEHRDSLLEKETEVLDEFFIDFETTIPSWNVWIVRKFCRSQTTFNSDFWRQSRAKLDGRCCYTELQREYPGWLSPVELQHHLDKKVG